MKAGLGEKVAKHSKNALFLNFRAMSRPRGGTTCTIV